MITLPTNRLRFSVLPFPVSPISRNQNQNSKVSLGFRISCNSQPPLLLSSTSSAPPSKSSVLLDTLRVLEWEKLCDCVSSFAGTSIGREATKMKLWTLDMSYEESIYLLQETAAAVEMMKFGIGGMDFSGINTDTVQSAIARVLRGFPVNGVEAMAVAGLIQSAKVLHASIKASVKDDGDAYSQFMPLIEMILVLPVSCSFANSVHQVMDEDGTVKDTASSELKRAREHVRMLEKKLFNLMEKLIRLETNETSSEINIVNGRWCLKVTSDLSKRHEGLLLSSGTGFESLIEPLAAVPLNDELQQARSLAARAEESVLSKLTDKMLSEIDDIRSLLDSIAQLDVIIARAKYSIAYGGSYPELVLPKEKPDILASATLDAISNSDVSRSKWKFYARRAYHPLLLKQYQENLQMAKKDMNVAISELRRMKIQGSRMIECDNMELTISSLKLRVAEMEEECPVPVDVIISSKTNVIVITGPNTGGKTISLKTVGLAALMAKTGLYVIASEPVEMPWFDAIFADIGDEQSISQSLSTFSGHLKRISAIQANSTDQSLVLLDEVGAGTNPLEGAALGMSLLEFFAKCGALLTIATTHHGELKTLKYSNNLFENACMEFDEVYLKPTYKILWGVPGRSNAINIAERIGLYHGIVDSARRLYGKTSAEINEIILDMETFKQDFEHHLQEAQQKLMLTRQHHRNLLIAKRKIRNHIRTLKTRKVQAVMDTASVVRSLLQNKLRDIREVRLTQSQTIPRKIDSTFGEEKDGMPMTTVFDEPPSPDSILMGNKTSTDKQRNNAKFRVISNKLPKEGDEVLVSTLGKKATVLMVDPEKGELMIQANKMKLRIKLSDITL